MLLVALVACTGPTVHPGRTRQGQDTGLVAGDADGSWAGACVSDGTADALSLDTELALVDEGGALTGTFQYGVDGSTAIDVQRFRVAGTRTDQDLELQLVGNASTSGTPTTDFELEFALALDGDQLVGDLDVSDEDEGLLMSLGCTLDRTSR